MDPPHHHHHQGQLSGPARQRATRSAKLAAVISPVCRTSADTRTRTETDVTLLPVAVHVAPREQAAPPLLSDPAAAPLTCPPSSAEPWSIHAVRRS